MAIQGKPIGDVVVIAPEDKLMGGEECTQLKDELQDWIDKQFKKVVIDFSRVRWANSAGIGTVISCFLTMRRLNGEMRFARPTEKVRFYLRISKLDSVFDLYNTVEEAVASFDKSIDPEQ